MLKECVWCRILGKPRSKLQTWNFLTLTSESRNWSNEEVQGREVHAKDSHKDNSLSEQAAKKIHEAGNCELHKANSSNSSQTSAWHSKEYSGEVYTLMKYDGRLCKRSHTIGNTTSWWTGSQIQNSKQRHHRESEKSMPRETEKN